MKNPVNFAVIGCGSISQMQHIPNIAASDRLVLHTCCDVDSENLRVCRDKYGALNVTSDFTEAISDPDVEVICLATTEKVRLPIIKLAAELNKPVYVEKPLAATLEEMYQIQRVVNNADIPFCVGHNRRNSPAMLDAHRIFRNHMENPQPCQWRWSRLGADRPHLKGDGVAAMSVRVNDDWHSWKSWVFDHTHNQYGQMLFEMTHFTDLCNWFLNAEPDEVVALESCFLNSGVVIRYQTGELATICLAANGSAGYGKELYEVMGNGGVVVVDHMLEVRTAGITGAPAKKIYPHLGDAYSNVGVQGGFEGWLEKNREACRNAVEQGDPSLAWQMVPPDKGHAASLERFVDEIQGLGPKVCPVDDAVRATRVAFAAIQSAREKRAVKLEEL